MSAVRRPARARPAAPAPRREASAGSAAILERLRAICLALPEAREKLSHGEPTWFAGGGKVFAMFDDHHHGARHVSVWLPAPPGAQSVLIANDPERFFRPPYLGHRGWVGVVLDGRPRWPFVAELVEQAYRLVAAPRLVARLDER
ncbi:MAG: phosphoribosylglycinamide formyltransferase [Proteobacteria bacterium]|nr:MAG: phosphoribosylglycinamide formyltransferase [Pseudomonadota bacterium]